MSEDLNKRHKAALDVALLDLDVAAIPSKSDVFVRCGPAARDLHDAITALIGEKLPGWSWSVGSDGQAAVSSPPKGHYVAFGTVANTPALALCAALLRALSTQPVSGEVADG